MHNIDGASLGMVTNQYINAALCNLEICAVELAEDMRITRWNIGPGLLWWVWAFRFSHMDLMIWWAWAFHFILSVIMPVLKLHNYLWKQYQNLTKHRMNDIKTIIYVMVFPTFLFEGCLQSSWMTGWDPQRSHLLSGRRQEPYSWLSRRSDDGILELTSWNLRKQTRGCGESCFLS